MEVYQLFVAVFFLLSPSSRGQDTVSRDIGAHQLERLVMLLTLKECEDLVEALSSSEENVFTRLERLSPENNQLLPLAKRALSTEEESEAKCRTALTDWLLEFGEEIYYDRLTRALQHIGRTDVAIEVGKNINQDKSLSLKRYVEDYHQLVSTFAVPQELDEAKNSKMKRRYRKLKGGDLSWRDLELIIERTPVSRYSRGPLDVIVPMICGLLMGFGGILLVGLCVSWLALKFLMGPNRE